MDIGHQIYLTSIKEKKKDKDFVWKILVKNLILFMNLQNFTDELIKTKPIQKVSIRVCNPGSRDPGRF